MNKPWVYVAWIRNHQFPQTDQDREYPCVLLIDASSAEDAKRWGDQLYKDALSNDKQHSFLWSEVHTRDDPRYKNDTDWSEIPRCKVGQRLPSKLLY
jgi:hypothetical protein